MNVAYFFKTSIISAASLLFTQACSAQQNNVDYKWKLKRNKNNIQVYTSKMPNSKYKAVRAVATIKGNLNSGVAAIKDTSLCPELVALCDHSRVIKTVSLQENYVYTYNNLPFPVRDRDIVAHVFWSKDLESGRVTMTSTAVNGRKSTLGLPPLKKVVRIEKAYMQWHFTQKNEETLYIETYAHIEPNGALPAWISNSLLVNTPYMSLLNIKEILASGRYSSATQLFSSKPIETMIQP